MMNFEPNENQIMIAQMIRIWGKRDYTFQKNGMIINFSKDLLKSSATD